MSKYYTPNIEEFHDGFRYQYNSDDSSCLDPTNGKWQTEVFVGECGVTGESEYDDICNMIERDQVRVKYLDREDIEMLGWNSAGVNEYGMGKFIIEKSPQGWMDEVYHKYSLNLTSSKGRISIFRKDSGGFAGLVDHPGMVITDMQCKNINELEKLMEQLNIPTRKRKQ